MSEWVFEYRKGGTFGNMSKWGRNGLWRGDEFVLGDEPGWEGGYQPPSDEMAKRITDALNALEVGR